jgi:hypothetical protein
MESGPVPNDPLAFIRNCVSRRRIRWTYHVAMRQQQRSLSVETLHNAVDSPEIIEVYPRDKYLPSFLLRGEQIGFVFHARIATDVVGDNIRVVTMYKPDREKWDESGRTRRIGK